MLPFLLQQAKDGAVMNREQAVSHYLLAVAAYRKWFENGFITEREFLEIKSHAADRHGLPDNSIYR